MPRPPLKFPEFERKEVRKEAELGCGLFGSVRFISGRYEKKNRNVVPKQNIDFSEGSLDPKHGKAVTEMFPNS